MCSSLVLHRMNAKSAINFINKRNDNKKLDTLILAWSSILVTLCAKTNPLSIRLRGDDRGCSGLANQSSRSGNGASVNESECEKRITTACVKQTKEKLIQRIIKCEIQLIVLQVIVFRMR